MLCRNYFARRNRQKRKDSENSTLVSQYLLTQLEIDQGSVDIMNTDIFKLSPLEAEDIEWAIEGFSDRFAIGYESEQQTNTHAGSARVSQSWFQRLLGPEFPYAINLDQLTVEQLVEIAKRGYWPRELAL